MTRRLNLLVESLTGAVQPDVQVVQRKAESRGFAVEIHVLDQVAILFRQSGQKPLEAAAQNPFGGGIGLLNKLGLQPFEQAGEDLLPST